jgi:hypothetical protein
VCKAIGARPHQQLLCHLSPRLSLPHTQCCPPMPSFLRAQGEEGIDAGGVTREWYTVMAREVFNLNLALFVQASVCSSLVRECCLCCRDLFALWEGQFRIQWDQNVQ